MNKLYHGDNLAILQEMPDASVDLIATDPPFNTGKDWGAFSDKWEGGLKGYLKFMEARCAEMHRVLKDTGSFYLHCDPTASHYLKVMLDGVFGIKQFRNEIVWKRHCSKSNHSRSKYYHAHDVILFHTKSSQYPFNREYLPVSESTIKRYNRVDENGRRYAEFVAGGQRKTKTKRFFLDESKGVAIDSLWIENIQLGNTDDERLGYPTQKPVSLYQRIIKASSNQGDVVLDPFAGSGTTLDAAHALGRHWIGIDSGEQAIATIVERMRNRHGLEYDRDYEKRG